MDGDSSGAGIHHSHAGYPQGRGYVGARCGVGHLDQESGVVQGGWKRPSTLEQNAVHPLAIVSQSGYSV